MVLQQKPLEKADFIVKITGPVGQFWQMESALSQDYLHLNDHIPITCNNYPTCKKEYKRNKNNILHALLQKEN